MIRSHPYASINWIRFIGLAPVPLVHTGTPLSSFEHPVEEVTLYYQQEIQASTRCRQKWLSLHRGEIKLFRIHQRFDPAEFFDLSRLIGECLFVRGFGFHQA